MERQKCRKKGKDGGVVGKKLTPEEKSKVIADYVMLQNYSQVARKYGIAINTVKNIVDKDTTLEDKCKKKKEEIEIGMEAFMQTQSWKARKIIELALDLLGEKDTLKKATVSQVATMMGIVIDKFVQADNSKNEATFEKARKILGGVEDAFNSKAE
nr:MAG TPA: hypothetical protein [Caudoviricetes sp.]